MEDEKKRLSPQEDIKEKLKLARARYRQSEKLLGEIERDHAKFTELRNALNDRENGAKAVTEWTFEQRRQLTELAKLADDRLKALEAAANGVQKAIDDITTKYGRFIDISGQVFHKESGMKPMLTEVRRLRKQIGQMHKQASTDTGAAAEKLTTITATATKVATAYDEFLVKKADIDNEETGLVAQLRRATEYADEVLEAKTKAESALVSTSKFKDQSDVLLGNIKESKKTIDGYEKESLQLTETIRNNLDLAAANSLSAALRDRRKSLGRQMIVWGTLQFLALAGLIGGVGLVFYALFIHGTIDAAAITARLQNGPTLMSAVSKILFTTPLAFAVYFTTTNYSHVRDLRDKYAWKETVAKSFQNYLQLMHERFDDKRYEEERFRFSMETIRDIYSEPNPTPKKRKYNIGYNRVFDAGFEEEDLVQIKQTVESGIREAIDWQEERADKATTAESTKSEKTVVKLKPGVKKSSKTNNTSVTE